MRSEDQVGILGPWQTYSHAAAMKYLGTDENTVPLPTIDSVFAGIITGDLHSGIVPIWNSTCGLVSDTAISILRRLAPPPGTCAATWWKCPLEVVDQLALPIRHCLAGFGQLEEVRKVTSKIQAIDQCRGWLRRNLPNVDLIPCDSTAAGLAGAKDDPSLAVISSSDAALQSGTPVVREKIQDDDDNHTEFLVIRRQEDVQRRTFCSKSVEYWVGKKKGGGNSNVGLQQKGPGEVWRDQYEDFGETYQFLKIRSKNGKSEGVSNLGGQFSIRWPLGWAEADGS